MSNRLMLICAAVAIAAAVLFWTNMRNQSPETDNVANTSAEDTPQIATSEPEEAVAEDAIPEAVELDAVEPEVAEPVMDTEVVASPDYGLEIDIAGEANGTLVIDLFEDVAPLHVAQITAIAAAGSYNNVVFHRVIDGFMAQTGDVQHGIVGGDMRRAGTGASELPNIAAEFSDELHFERGVIGMARSQSPDSANSQFFIMFAPGYFLDGQYTIVGEVTSGMDIVDQIKLGAGPNGSVIGAPDRMVVVRVTK